MPLAIEVCGKALKPLWGITLDIAEEGVRLRVPSRLRVGSDLKITVCLFHQQFECFAHVVWCRNIDHDYYEVGVALLDETDSFKVKTAEQLKAIREHLEQRRASGTELNIHEACREWVQNHLEDFPTHLQTVQLH
jgi:hypothetical protein